MTMTYKRFNPTAIDTVEAFSYLRDRIGSLLHTGLQMTLVEKTYYGARGLGVYNDVEVQMIILSVKYRGKGLYERLLLPDRAVLTVPDCQIEGFLLDRNIQYILLNPIILNTPAYRAVTQYYGNRVAERSQVPYMYHIDEGLYVLSEIGASKNSKEAYCLHPLFQNDEDLKRNQYLTPNMDPYLTCLVMEYRSVANEYLSDKCKGPDDKIRLSPIEEVNDMLCADKIQNYKDFLIYHKDTHPYKERLDQYFRNWLRTLNVDLEKAHAMMKTMDVEGKLKVL